MQEYRHGALLPGEICDRTQPVVKGQTNARQSDRHAQSERQDHAHRRALTQDNQTLGNGMAHHGGHIPS
jgi:hypothetical protein